MPTSKCQEGNLNYTLEKLISKQTKKKNPSRERERERLGITTLCGRRKLFD